LLHIAITLSKLTILGGGRHVVCTTDEIVGVLAIIWGGYGVEASLEAELVSTNERVPVEHLGERMAIGISSAIGEDDASERVTLEIGTVRIEFTTFVRGIQSNARVFDETDGLNIPTGFGPL